MICLQVAGFVGCRERHWTTKSSVSTTTETTVSTTQTPFTKLSTDKLAEEATEESGSSKDAGSESGEETTNLGFTSSFPSQCEQMMRQLGHDQNGSVEVMKKILEKITDTEGWGLRMFKSLLSKLNGLVTEEELSRQVELSKTDYKASLGKVLLDIQSTVSSFIQGNEEQNGS